MASIDLRGVEVISLPRAAFRACFSKPQYQHFVTVLFGLLCQEGRTLTGPRRQIAGGPSVASLSRFLAHAPWQPERVAQTRLAHFSAQMAPVVQAEQERQGEIEASSTPQIMTRLPRPGS